MNCLSVLLASDRFCSGYMCFIFVLNCMLKMFPVCWSKSLYLQFACVGRGSKLLCSIMASRAVGQGVALPTTTVANEMAKARLCKRIRWSLPVFVYPWRLLLCHVMQFCYDLSGLSLNTPRCLQTIGSYCCWCMSASGQFWKGQWATLA